MNPFTENNLIESTVISIIKKLWNDSSCHIDAFTDTEDSKLGRDHRGEVVLKKFLQPEIEKINPDISYDAIEEAINQLTRDRSHLSLVNANHEVYKLLKDGAIVTVPKIDGSIEPETVKFLDFNNPENNHFLCVSQFWVVGDMYTRRPDVVLFVNGIPLLLLELKASHKNLVDANRDNLRDYKDTIPKLFWYNMGVFISNGIENKFGSLTSPYEYFNDWKKVSSESDESNSNLTTMLSGVCDRNRMIDIFENFILFDTSKSETKKIVPRYFQYYGVNRAFEKVIKRKGNKGKLGVFWHTQGSGKSYSMVYLSQKVFRKLKGNFTFVIVTDRTELYRQTYKNFAIVDAVYEKEVHADSIAHLHALLSEDHRQIFTTIQKFQDIEQAISEREDIIIMTDEAHRTQYDRMARNMRKALPNASFIGFTGTPLMAKGEEKTRETFGDYVSVYNFAQSVKDGATVPLYYENRVPRLQNVNDTLEKDLSSVMNFYDLNDEEEERLEQEFSTFYQLVTREDRLDAIARDIVTHFVGRGYFGKAMVVSVDKKTAVRMYVKVQAEWERYIKKLRMDLSRTTDERERAKIESRLEQHENIDMAVVVSQGQNEIADLEPFEIDMRPLRARMQKKEPSLEEMFKDPENNLHIVFVCAMWLTGFDVPNLSTLYLDKPLKNHTLMQTIARANRVAVGKKNGLIVDYIGVFKNIEHALALYASSGIKDDDIIRGKSELLIQLENILYTVKKFLQDDDISLSELLHVSNEEKLRLLESCVNILVGNNERKKTFLNLSADLQAAYQSILPDPAADNYYQEVTAIRVIASRLRDVGGASIDVSQVKKDLEDLLDKSIQAGEYVISSHKKVKDLSALDADALHDFFESIENKNIQIEAMSAEIEEKISNMVKRNKARAKFMDRLKSVLDKYNSGAHDVDQVFDDLMELAKNLNEEEQRSVKENLTEEELAIFDLLLKENLNPDQVDKIRSVSRELLKKLKTEKLVSDWREWEATRAGVKTAIFDVLYSDLPEPTYSEQECEMKGVEVYNFVYQHYQDSRNFLAV